MFVCVANNKCIGTAKSPFFRVSIPFAQLERPARPGAITSFDVLLSNAGGGIKQDERTAALGATPILPKHL